MNKTSKSSISGQMWPRNNFIEILNTAITVGENRFARQSALAWLASYPGDLPITLIRAKALMADGLGRHALPILNKLIQTDPEFHEAQEFLSQHSSHLNLGDCEEIHGCDAVLKGYPNILHQKTPNTQRWPEFLAKTRHEMVKGDLQNAEKYLQQALSLGSYLPLTGITHLLVLRANQATPNPSIQKIAEHYHQQWPECIQFILILAESLLKGGDSEDAVAFLHQAATRDVTGQVATRLWGENHPYKNIWPVDMRGMIPFQIPAKVAAQLGWNLLPYPDLDPTNESISSSDTLTFSSGDNPQSEVKIDNDSPVEAHHFEESDYPSSSEPEASSAHPHSFPNDPYAIPETLKSMKEEIKEGPGKESHRNHSKIDGRFPVYVIFTTKSGLTRKYGGETTKILEQETRKLVASIRRRLDWGSILIYADEPSCMAQYGLKPASPDDAWKLKLAIVDLDNALGKRGAKIGALLILGGPDVVPFHLLPNPTDDADINVPSDNPYGTRDENYFITEWPVGRLPGGKGKDPGLLIQSLRSIADRHSGFSAKQGKRLISIWHWIIRHFISNQNQSQPSFGYTAEVWHRASSSVFRPIGDPRYLITSPPVTINPKYSLPSTKLGYFNLHGVEDSPEWFGQRDPRNGSTGPDYPIALQPKDLANGGRSPQVVFSEACYGANIWEKSVDEALALKFLACGSHAVIGSTVISYGSITTPLNAADLLAKAFWSNFKDGLSAGDSLRLAKISLVTEMQERQGYLDGEDQKTLISFVLYGDPLAQVKDIRKRKGQKIIAGKIHEPQEIKTVCDRVDTPGSSEPIPKEIIANVKNIVEQYLPGMRDAQIAMSREHAECTCVGHTCPTSQLGVKTKFKKPPQRRVITLSKQMVMTRQVYESYARLTLDSTGKVVKLTVSR